MEHMQRKKYAYHCVKRTSLWLQKQNGKPEILWGFWVGSVLHFATYGQVLWSNWWKMDKTAVFFITACLFVQLCSHSRVCSLGKSYQERLSLFLLRPEIKCAVLNQILFPASTFHTTTKDNFLISHLITLLENLSPFRMSYDHPVTANVFDHCRAKIDI